MENLTSSEKKRLKLIDTIQQLYDSGESIHGIVRITGIHRNAVKKYNILLEIELYCVEAINEAV